MNKKIFLLLVAILLTATASEALPPSRALMTFLTSPEIGGREAGTPEATRVADTLAALMQQIGLKPVTEDSYFQTFPVEVPRLDSTHTSIYFYMEGAGDMSESLEATLANGLFFFPRNGQSQSFIAPILNGGYGIVAPELGREDYMPKRAQGKALLLFLGAPPDSAFMPGGAGFKYSLSRVKTRLARESGALAVVFTQARGDSGRLQKELQTREQDFDPHMLQLPGTESFPIFYLDSDLGEQVQRISAANPGNLMASLSIGFTMEKPCSLRNVVGMVPGYDPEVASECILIGAHYDHLGRKGNIYYPGADDNASGVVALMAAAKTLVERPLARTVLCVFFGGEEKGLLGSKWLAEHPLGKANVVTMINLDGVGRKPSGHIPMGSPLKMNDTELTVFYSSQAPWIEEELGQIAKAESIKVTWDAEPVFHEFSDHASFHAKRIPTMFFFSGAHGDYHLPTDTPDKIEWKLLDKRVQFLTACVEVLANREARPAFEEEEDEKRP